MKNIREAIEYLELTSEESISVRRKFVSTHREQLVQGAEILGNTIRSGGKVMICGNGGSAADSQHMAAEMVGRMLLERRPLPAIALTTDTSNLTAVGNDYSYEEVFSRQVQALGRKEDCLVAISTSGKSRNVIRAVEEAKKLGCKVIGITGFEGGALKPLCDLALVVTEGKNSSRIQETHLFALHSLVDLMDRFFLSE